MKKAQWIWQNREPKADEHADFFCRFEYTPNASGERAVIKISADSDYALYLNGALVDFGQYADFPYYKVFDEIDVTDKLSEGENTLAVEAWYFGEHTSTYYKGDAGLWFELSVGYKVVLASDETTLSRLSRTYESHRRKFITTQLGYSYAYDARGEDGWLRDGAPDFAPSVTFDREPPKYARPVKKLVTEAPITGKLIKRDGNRYLFDFGRETVGIYKLRFDSAAEQKIRVSYGEHIDDGWVRSIIGIRDFSFDYTAREGENHYLGYKRRLGLRYLQIDSESSISEFSVEILPRVYPITKNAVEISDERLKKIYDVSVRTLELCMHEHYEDCPWREQALYSLDSRNQMLCGYYAFGEYVFPRESLRLLALGKREDGLMPICAPAGHNLAIPSFSLHYYTAVREYLEYSGDVGFVREIYPRLESLIGLFLDKLGDGSLISSFGAKEHWNFYEWSSHLDGVIGAEEEERCDLVLNLLLAMALDNMVILSDRLGIENGYAECADRIRAAVNSAFFDESTSAYKLFSDEPIFTELGNALAVLSGAARGERAEKICEMLIGENRFVKLTLSMRCFLYDALILTDREKYLPWIFENIKAVWGRMLDEGATSFWETEDGAEAFGKAGSLCHGWSALPVYYIGKFRE